MHKGSQDNLLLVLVPQNAERKFSLFRGSSVSARDTNKCPAFAERIALLFNQACEQDSLIDAKQSPMIEAMCRTSSCHQVESNLSLDRGS